MLSLLKSRKFWLTVVNVLMLIFADVLGLEPDVLEAIRVVLMFLVGMIAVEDAAAKIHGNFRIE